MAEPDGYWNQPDPRESYPPDSGQSAPYGGPQQYAGGPPADGGYRDGGYPQPGYPQPGYPPERGPLPGAAPGSYPPPGPGYPSAPGYGPGPGDSAPAAGGYPPPGSQSPGSQSPRAAGPPTGPFPPMGQPAPGPAAGGHPGDNGWDEPTDTREAGTSVRRALVPRAGAGRAPTRPPARPQGATGPGNWQGGPPGGPENALAAQPRPGGARGDLYQREPVAAGAPPRAEPTDVVDRAYSDAPPSGPSYRGIPDRGMPDRGRPDHGLPEHGVDDRDPAGRGFSDRGFTDRPGADRGPAERGGTGPRRGGTGPRRGGFADADYPDEPDFPDGDDDDYPAHEEESGLGPFLRRLAIALLVLGVALGVGVGAGVVWEKVRPGDSSTESDAGSAAPPATPAPGAASPSAAPNPNPTPTAAAQVAVPADWVAYTDAEQRATFSHPPTWKQRRDNTGVFFGEPGGGATGTSAEYGPQMIGVARVAGVDATTALNQVQVGEFGSVSGLTRDRAGAATDSSGAPTQEIAGSYDRDGHRVSYLMRTVEAPGTVYVLIARVSADASGTLNTLMGALRTSFQPAG